MLAEHTQDRTHSGSGHDLGVHPAINPSLARKQDRQRRVRDDCGAEQAGCFPADLQGRLNRHLQKREASLAVRALFVIVEGAHLLGSGKRPRSW